MKRNIILMALFLSGITASAQQVLSLQQVKEQALAHNISIRTAEDAVREAREQKKEAFANYFPQVSATGMGFKTNTDMLKTSINTASLLPSSLATALPPALAGMIPPTLSFSMLDRGLMAGVAAVQPIFAGGRIINGNKLARAGVEASEIQKQISENNVELTATQYYWQIISLKEKQRTLDAVDAMLRQLEHDATIAVKAGVGMRNDLLQVQLRQNEVESNRIKLDNGLRLARRVLAQYIGAEGETDAADTVNTASMPPFLIQEVNNDAAVAATPEYKLLQKNVEVTRLQKQMEIGKNLPSISVGATYSHYNMDQGMKNTFGMVFATVTVPISQWWGGSHAIRRRQIAEDVARRQLADNRQLLAIRIQKNRDDVDDAYRQLVIARKGIEQSEENLRLNRDFYQAGTVTMNDLLDAQQKYQQCRDRYIEAYAAWQIKIVEYEQSIGR
ncbi:MAG: TolC family protein [Prevotellaceae bacterium]|nr:TolC family protein [Prevotellaceae bacterium]